MEKKIVELFDKITSDGIGIVFLPRTSGFAKQRMRVKLVDVETEKNVYHEFVEGAPLDEILRLSYFKLTGKTIDP